MARSIRVARALGVAAVVALAACTHEERRYGYYGNNDGPSYGSDNVPPPYGNGYGPPPDGNGAGQTYGYGPPYGNGNSPPYGYGPPYRGDYCTFHHCPPKEWQL